MQDLDRKDYCVACEEIDPKPGMAKIGLSRSARSWPSTDDLESTNACLTVAAGEWPSKA